MSGSTYTVQNCIDDAFRFAELKPVLQVGGSSMEPALTIATEIMTEMLSPQFNWKFNSFLFWFYTISWQNDYASPWGSSVSQGNPATNNGLSITNLGWLENAIAVDINSTQIPKRKFKMEVVRDQQSSSDAYGRPFQASWEPVNTLLYGSWGSGLTVPNVNNTGQTNPGPNVVYTNPLGAATTPSNPVTQIIDPNGNIQVLTTFGTCGGTIPSFPAAGAAAGVTTTDGTSVWTVIDPKAQGVRIQNIPTQSGIVFQVLVRAQFKPIKFTGLGQFINPIPDDFAPYFQQGFRAKCYQRSPEAAVRAKFPSEMSLWLEALNKARGQDSREVDGFAFYPSDDIMGGGFDWPFPGPAWPFGPPY